MIARALAQEPQVLLLDEPTAHLDLKHQAAILSLIRTLAREQSLAVMLTMHDLNQAAHCADKIAILSDGKIQALGTPNQVLTAELLSTAYGLPVEVVTHPYHGTPLVVLSHTRSSTLTVGRSSIRSNK